MKVSWKQLSAHVFCIGLAVSIASAVDMQTVPVGNVGNLPDTRYNGVSVGGVGYSYQMGKYEVTAGQYTQFLNAVAKTDPYELYNISMDTSVYSGGCNIKRTGNPGSYAYSVAADWADRPVNWVSWVGTARFANWLHNGQPIGLQGPSTTEDGSYDLSVAMTDPMLVTRRPNATWVIPSEDEWYKAAYHQNNGPTGDYWDYPTRTNIAPSNILTSPADLGNNATFHSESYTIGDPYWRTEVGAHENSASPYGTYDQGGNVWEWNEAMFYGSDRGLRGGEWISVVDFLHAAHRYVTFYPTVEGEGIGFRVALVPEPLSIMLLAIGAVGLARRGKAT